MHQHLARITLIVFLLHAIVGRPALASSSEPTSSTRSAEATVASALPATPRHALKSVRLRPSAGAFRVIFLFDSTAPYTLKEDPARRRATLEFMNAAFDALPPELARIEDPRLAGIWLKRQDAGLVTLELRFPAGAVRLEHFALDEPPAVVLDVFLSSGDAVQITGAPEETNLTPRPGLPSPTPPPDPEAVTHGAPSPVPAVPQAASNSQWVAGVRGSMLPLPAAPPEHPAPIAVSQAAPNTPHPAPTASHAAPAAASHSATLRRGEAEPLDADYEFFPLSALRLKSPDALDVRENFLARRWATVLRDGVAFLEQNKISPETSDVLLMIAEAKWQLSWRQSRPPLSDTINMFQQAARLANRPEMVAFCAYRQAQAAMFGNDYDVAIDASGRAMASSQEGLRLRAVLMRIQSLEALRRYEDALATIATANTMTSGTSDRVNFLIKEGNLRTAQGDYPGAWDAYCKATALDDKWIRLYPDGAKGLARAALETNHLAEARAAAEYLSYNNPGPSEEKLKIALLLADILTRQGDLQAGEETYYKILKDLPTKESGALALQRMFALYPVELLEGECRYSLLLAQQGRVREAMADLVRIHEDAMRAGGPVRRLDPALRTVVPLFMEDAVRNNNPFEAIGAWKKFGYTAATSETLRRRCLLPLAEAFEKLDLYDEALRVLGELRHNAGAPANVSQLELATREARLHIKAGNPEQGVRLLEDLLAQAAGPETRMEIFALLGDGYLKMGARLEAAQALQSLAETEGCPPARRDRALLEAAGIFLDNTMPDQAIELGLKGLVFEKQALEHASAATADPTEGNALRMTLARAYQAAGDLARQKIVLMDLLRRPGLLPEQKTQIEIMLGNNQRLTGQLSEAEQLYQSVAGNTSADANWRKAAEQMKKIMDWNRKHPDEAIDLTPPSSIPAAGVTTGTMTK